MVITEAPPEVITEKELCRPSLDAAEQEAAADAAAAATPLKNRLRGLLQLRLRRRHLPPGRRGSGCEPAATPTRCGRRRKPKFPRSPKDRRLLWIGLLLFTAIAVIVLMRKRKPQA